ncbi:TIGR02530 family flagellar biosynthesis protein [Oceanobacillus sojae]|uniref:TIGR02530 family flagellar biosynthesis protein n=1 Tax=Oceanobacillus sojae TaxID=582851 RepID=UPI0021A71F26|nr:TIGR02530 family flagellar biosynthesis protein [Oceanobacillus sojae]MCT1903755.1 flagellar protein [Oceanobacillus sojae]
MVRPIQPIVPAISQEQYIKKAAPKKGNVSFGDILRQQQGLTVSKHAADRMRERNIQFSNKEWESIQEKVKEAKQKGVKDALVVVDGSAMVVSVKNNTVITALNQAEADKKVFTNIDGTILL